MGTERKLQIVTSNDVGVTIFVRSININNEVDRQKLIVDSFSNSQRADNCLIVLLNLKIMI